MLHGRWFRPVLTVALVALTACSSTATSAATADSRSGAAQWVSGTLLFGTWFDSRYLGRWTMSDRFARSCTYQFAAEPMGNSQSIARATPAGYCVPPFDDVAGWRVSGRDLNLFDSRGNRLAALSADGESFRGRYSGRTLSIEVVLRRGFV